MPKRRAKALIPRDKLDHPEHFDDIIREYRSSERYVPTVLESLLLELAGHHCTICRAPWLEIHHIEELANGGKTEYDNLIVLCPNCHTRVHKTGMPSKEELKQYKLKQETAYELPIISRLSVEERKFLLEVANEVPEFDWIHHADQLEMSCALAPTPDAAIQTVKQTNGFQYSLETGILATESEAVELDERSFPCTHRVKINIHLTAKGFKWLQYLKNTSRIAMLSE